jgi:hypothetical protein
MTFAALRNDPDAVAAAVKIVRLSLRESSQQLGPRACPVTSFMFSLGLHAYFLSYDKPSSDRAPRSKYN